MRKVNIFAMFFSFPIFRHRPDSFRAVLGAAEEGSCRNRHHGVAQPEGRQRLQGVLGKRAAGSQFVC